MSRLADRVGAVASAVTAAVLVVVGVGVGAALHLQARRALDDALLAAAHAYTPSRHARWEADHSASPVEVAMVRPGEPHAPDDLATRALRRERPERFDEDGLRTLLLPVEPPHDDEEGEDEHPHALIAAWAPSVSLARSVGPFAVLYAAVAALAALGGAVVQRRVATTALEPLARGAAAVERVVGLGPGARVPAEGPDEVRTLLDAVNALLGRLDAAFAAQARFTAEAAHELRTPVTVLRGELEVALRRPREAAEYVAALQSAHEEVVRLGDLVEGLMALARVDAGQAEQARERVRAADVARAAAARAEAALAAAGCVLHLRPEEGLFIFANEALLVTALANLLRNAARYAPGAPVTLTVAPDRSGARFTVDDGGPGVPEAERDALFNRFARGAAARRAWPGGLGLPLAREIARRHGGDCWIEAAPGGGARVVLRVG